MDNNDMTPPEPPQHRPPPMGMAESVIEYRRQKKEAAYKKALEVVDSVLYAPDVHAKEARLHTRKGISARLLVEASHQTGHEVETIMNAVQLLRGEVDELELLTAAWNRLRADEEGCVGIAKEFIPAGSLLYFNGEQLGTSVGPIKIEHPDYSDAKRPTPIEEYLLNVSMDKNPTFEDLALSGPFLGIGDEGQRVNGQIKTKGLDHLRKELTGQPTGEEEAPGWEHLQRAEKNELNSWRVVIIDNFNRENVNDRLYCVAASKELAEEIAKRKNDGTSDTSPNYYQAYAPGKELFEWKP
jgi:hypothetical protein